MQHRILKLIGSVIVCGLIGEASALVTVPGLTGWYETLAKSPLSPPDWVFGVVWTLLFSLMGIAIYLIWEKGAKKEPVGIALQVFLMQLILNVLWTVIFFGSHDPLAAFWEILALIIAVAWMICRFWKVSRPAAWLMAPYFLWLLFAAYLNYMIVVLNR